MLFKCLPEGAQIPGRFPGPVHARGKWFTIDIHCHVRSEMATRPSRIAPLPTKTVDRVVALTNQAPPHQATHWTAAAMAKAVAISPSSVRRIWTRHGLPPHRVRLFKLSNDAKFADKLKEVVGLYVDPPAGRKPDPWVDPPAHAVVLSIDEKSQIQALDRTQPGLPMKKGALRDH